ncbi:MAG TPA: hypothetical protein VFG08_09720, partial [Candidatus Polarisedimenticolia bacterium]|nr:hypothetical protein [Candidatus Polarisedimenticolia bacterium]
RWLAMSVTGVPPARDRHTAVWTGTRMVVWGGVPPEVLGGAYCACTAQNVTPSVATDLRFSDAVTLLWSATAGIPVYNLYRGTIPGGAWSYDHVCHDPGLTAPTAPAGADPALGTGYYYLVSGEGACGEGPVGTASDSTPRPIPFACP